VTEIYLGFATFLLVNLVGGLVRIGRGPTRADRMLAALLFGTTGVAVLLVLAEALGESALRNVALVFTVLAVVSSVVFVWHARRLRKDEALRPW
jgi:multicomponent Na+:H+ antiporter subunit F